jgi:tetratricopeptide (TPR) repeat protein
MWRIFILIPVSVTLTSAATCPNMRSFRNAALLVGISGPAFQEGPRDLQFAGADADLLQNLFAQQFGPENVFELKNSEATTAQVSGCLDGLARWAQPGSKVIVFISARGFSSSQMDDGYVVTSDAAIDKLPRFGGQQAGNGISIQTLRRKMSAMQAREKYLLLDLCRDPAETPAFDNLINNRLLDKKFLDAATRQIVLASNGSRRSFESAELHNGFYASSLADALKAAPGSDLLKIFEDLRAKLKLKSRARQTPDRPAPAPGDGWQDCPFCKLSRISGSLLASLSPEFVFQAGPPAAPASDLSDDLSSDRNNDVSDESEASDREESAQRVFVRYGEGDHFGGDPFHQCENTNPEFEGFRLCREEYQTAALRFERAAELRQTIPSSKLDPDAEPRKQLAIASLLERARFCRAQMDLLTTTEDMTNRAAQAVADLGNPSEFRFAESHNILGIAYLDLAKYPEAESQFELAARMAPHWAYPRHNLALAYIEHGNYSAAENEYREAIRWTPVGEKVRSDKSNPCFHGQTVMVSARPYLYYNLGVLLQRLNRLADAQKEFCMAEVSFRYRMQLLNPGGDQNDPYLVKLAKLRAAAAQINLADVNNSLGVLFEARGKNARAMAQFEEALSNNPELTAASFNIARLKANRALARHDPAAAKQSFQQVLNLPVCLASNQDPKTDQGCRAAKNELDRLASPVEATRKK